MLVNISGRPYNESGTRSMTKKKLIVWTIYRCIERPLAENFEEIAETINDTDHC